MDEHATHKSQGSRLLADTNPSSNCDARPNPTSNRSVAAHGNATGEPDADPDTHVDTGPDLATSPNSKPYTCANADADARSDSDPCPDSCSYSYADPNPGASRGWASCARRQ